MSEEPASVRRRPLLAIPGWLLFGCLFLPTLEVCGDPTMPIQFPPSYAVYLGGLVIGLLGSARSAHARRRAFSVLLMLWTLTLFAIATVAAISGMLLLGIFIGTLLTWVQIRLALAMSRTAWSDTAIGIGCFVHAVIATGWSALMVFDADGLWGAHVAMWAGLAIAIASILLFAQARDEEARKRRDTEPAPLPRARAIVRD